MVVKVHIHFVVVEFRYKDIADMFVGGMVQVHWPAEYMTPCGGLLS